MITESILLILLFALMFTGGYVIKRSLFSPWSITLLVWIVVLTLYVTVDHGLQPISSQMIYGLLLWVVPFCITSYTVSALTPQYNAPRWEPCEKNVDILTFISMILVPYATIKAFRNAIQMASPEGLFYTIREQTTKDSNKDFYEDIEDSITKKFK
jgi:energy-coupling factor transporter transmembrane protein EcfT